MFGRRKPHRSKPTESMSPTELYVAGGGDLAAALPRLQALLAEADRGHQRGVSKPKSPSPARHDGIGGSPADVVRAYRRTLAEEAAAEAERGDDFKRSWAVEKRRRDAFVDSFCRRATARDYADWLTGYLATGGTVRYCYSYSLPSDFFVLTGRPLGSEIPVLYGALSFSAIVPADVDLDPAEVSRKGHNSFFFERGFVATDAFAPLYADVAALLDRARS